MTQAKVILDSIEPFGSRLTTIECKFHRFILAELNTHRVFSKNSASSRAIPVEKIIDRVLTDPAYPLEWGSNKPGMQAGEQLSLDRRDECRAVWDEARLAAVISARELTNKGLHKQVVNRLLEPFMWHTAIISSTEWDNFLKQRDNPGAQPEMQALAREIRRSLETSKPISLDLGEWHTPYIQEDEYSSLSLEERVKVSAARAARVSYLTHDGVRDKIKDLELYNKLVGANPPHWSPLEHVATPGNGPGNFVGWRQLRHYNPFI